MPQGGNHDGTRLAGLGGYPVRDGDNWFDPLAGFDRGPFINIEAGHTGADYHSVIQVSFFCKVRAVGYDLKTDTRAAASWHRRVRSFKRSLHLSLLLAGSPLGGPVSFAASKQKGGALWEPLPYSVFSTASTMACPRFSSRAAVIEPIRANPEPQ